MTIRFFRSSRIIVFDCEPPSQFGLSTNKRTDFKIDTQDISWLRKFLRVNHVENELKNWIDFWYFGQETLVVYAILFWLFSDDTLRKMLTEKFKPTNRKTKETLEAIMKTLLV